MVYTLINYDGRLIDFKAPRTTEAEILEDEDSIFRLSISLIRHYVDRIKTKQKDNTCRVLFHFDH